MLLKDVPLGGPYCHRICTTMAPFWFSMEHHWIVVTTLLALNWQNNALKSFSVNKFTMLYCHNSTLYRVVTINNFKKTRDRMKKLCALLCIKSFPSTMTPRSLIFMKAFWFYGRFSEAMSFSRIALLSQKSQLTYGTENIPLFGFPE